MTKIQEFRLRFNTDYPKKLSLELMPWRLLAGSDLSSLREIAATEVTFNTPTWDTHDILPSVGEKWHMGGKGTLRMNGSQFVVQGHDDNAFKTEDLVTLGEQIHGFGMVRVSYNKNHTDYPHDTPVWQGIYGGEDDVTEWRRVRIDHVRFNVVTMTMRTLLKSGEKWHFGGYGVPFVVTDENGTTLVVNPKLT